MGRGMLQLRNCEEEKEINEYARKNTKIEGEGRWKMEDKKRLEEMMTPRGTRENENVNGV